MELGVQSTMSFSSEIKHELCKVENRKLCCLKAECYGIWLFSKCFSLKNSAYVTEHGDVARRMSELAAAAASVQVEMSFAVSRRKKPAYRVELVDDASREQLLQIFGHTGREPSLRINRGNFKAIAVYRLSCGGLFWPAEQLRTPIRNIIWNFLYPTGIWRGSFVRFWRRRRLSRQLLLLRREKVPMWSI